MTLWDVRSRSLRHGPFPVSEEPIIGISISADGTTLATAGGDGVELWDVATGAPLGTVGDGSAAGDVAFSPTGSLVAFVREGFDETGGGDAEIWDISGDRSPRSLMRLDGRGYGYAVAFSPGRRDACRCRSRPSSCVSGTFDR